MKTIKFYLKNVFLLLAFLAVLTHPYAMEKDEDDRNNSHSHNANLTIEPFSLLPSDVIQPEISKFLLDEEVNALKFTCTYFHKILKDRIYPFFIKEILYSRSFNTWYLDYPWNVYFGKKEINNFKPEWNYIYRVLIDSDKTDYYFNQLKSRLREKHIYEVGFKDESLFLKWSQRRWLEPFRGLRLSAWPITLNGLHELLHSDRMSHLTSLNLNNLEMPIDNAEATQNSFQSKYGLSIADSITELLGAATALDNLEYLDIGHNKITPKGLQTLGNSKNFKKLKFLNFSSNNLDKTELGDWGALNNFPNLTSLDLSYCKLGINEINGLITVSSLPNLIHLNLSGNHIDSEALKILGKWSILLNLNTLKLTCNCTTILRKSDGKHFIKADTLIEWPILPKLKELDLSGNSINVEEIQHLTNSRFAPNLKHLNLSYNKLHGEGIVPLVRSSLFARLESLNLMGMKIKSYGLFFLTKALKHNTSLRKLHIGGRDIGIEGITLLLRYLKENTSLEQLYSLQCAKEHTELMQMFLEDFRIHNTTLRFIDLPEPPKNDDCFIL